MTRICRAILPESENGIQQIVYYQAGVGTENNLFDHVVGGGTGAGLSEHIREGYGFLANNYQAGDEIFLIGFSRGAFTARSIAGLISSIGLLTKRGLTHFYEIFKDWENQITPNYVSKFPDVPFPIDRPLLSPHTPRSLRRYVISMSRRFTGQAELVMQLGFSRLNIPTKAVGVWDTVGTHYQSRVTVIIHSRFN